MLDFGLPEKVFVEQYKDFISSVCVSKDYTSIIIPSESTGIKRVFLPTSDIIIVFDNKSEDVVACVERDSLLNYNKFKAALTKMRVKRISKQLPSSFEVYTNIGGEFFEVQMYRRWWYDIARNVHSVDTKHVGTNDQ